MKQIFNWKRNFFNGAYQIYSHGTIIGSMREKPFSNTAFGAMNGKNYKFTNSGFLNRAAQIIDLESNSSIGKITYNTWMTKARIKFADKEITWRFINTWKSKWNIFDSSGVYMNYNSSVTSGKIEFEEQNALLLLTGLYIYNYHRSYTMAIIFAALIPILTLALH